MSRVWLIARHHLSQEASKRSFLLVLFSLPLFLTATIGLSLLLAQARENHVVLGYVDPGGFLAGAGPMDAAEKETLRPFAKEDDARAALEEEQIAGYYLLPSAYPASQQVEIIFYERPPWRAQLAFVDLVRRQLLAERDPDVVFRALEGPEVRVQASEAGREFAAGGPRVSDFIPLLVAAVFGFLIMTTSGYMMEVLAAEKENRTMEILITSTSPGKMMRGKILGAIAIAALQLIVWVAFLLAAVWVGGDLLEIGWLQELDPNPRGLLQMIAVAVPVYLCISALFTVVGATLTETHEAQQVGPLFLVLLYLPIWILLPLAGNLDGAVARALSFFPPTALTAFGTRMIFMAVPWWQIGIAATIALAAAAALTWLAGRALRLNMLRYGQRLPWRRLLRRRQRAPILQPRSSS